MSIVALKRNSKRYKARVSGQGNKGFSLNGGHRNQGWVGQGVRGRSLTGTPYRGVAPMGNGGCCGTYVEKINNRSSNCCTNDVDIIKRSTMNTLGYIDSSITYPTSVFNTSCVDGKCPKIQNWVKDFSPLNHGQGEQIFKKAREHGKCVIRVDDAGLDKCDTDCDAASYHIGGKKFVREPYYKTTNKFATGGIEYQRTGLMKSKNLPTPDCKAPYPMALNHNGNCQTNFMTGEEAIKGGMLPHDWMKCLPCQSDEEKKAEPKYKIKLKLHKNLTDQGDTTGNTVGDVVKPKGTSVKTSDGKHIATVVEHKDHIKTEKCTTTITEVDVYETSMLEIEIGSYDFISIITIIDELKRVETVCHGEKNFIKIDEDFYFAELDTFEIFKNSRKVFDYLHFGEMTAHQIIKYVIN